MSTQPRRASRDGRIVILAAQARHPGRIAQRCYGELETGQLPIQRRILPALSFRPRRHNTVDPRRHYPFRELSFRIPDCAPSPRQPGLFPKIEARENLLSRPDTRQEYIGVRNMNVDLAD